MPASAQKASKRFFISASMRMLKVVCDIYISCHILPIHSTVNMEICQGCLKAGIEKSASGRVVVGSFIELPLPLCSAYARRTKRTGALRPLFHFVVKQPKLLPG
jgi:hypothetical protein